MDWLEILTIIGTLTVIFITINYAFFEIVKAKFDNLAKGQAHIKELLDAKLAPIKKDLENHVKGTEDKIKKLETEIKELKNEIKALARKILNKIN